MNVCSDVGFSDATRVVWVARIVAWRRRIAQAGNRGVGLGVSFVVMGIGVVRVFSPRSDRPVEWGRLGQARGWLCQHLIETRGILMG